MDREMLERMLELAKREKARLEKTIHEINLELKRQGSNGSLSTVTRPRQRQSKTAKAEKVISDILASAEKPMRPKEIAEKATEMGKDIGNNLVRQILSRSKGHKFVSPERGLWLLKGKRNGKTAG